MLPNWRYSVLAGAPILVGDDQRLVIAFDLGALKAM